MAKLKTNPTLIALFGFLVISLFLIVFFPFGPFSITGVIEAGTVAVTREPTYAANGVEIVLTSDTLVEPGTQITGTLYARDTPPTQDPQTRVGQLFIQRGTEKINIQGLINYGTGISPPTRFTTQIPTDLVSAKYELKFRDFGEERQSLSGRESSFNPRIDVWIVNQECVLDTEKHVIIQKSFSGGEIINKNALTLNINNNQVLPDVFCYNNPIIKHKADNITEQSVSEYEFLEKVVFEDFSFNVPQGELWEIEWFVLREPTGVPTTCEALTITEQEIGLCTTSVDLLDVCGGKLTFENGIPFCRETSLNPCDLGEFAFTNEEGDITCVSGPQVTVDNEGNQIICFPGIYNESIGLCEWPDEIREFCPVDPFVIGASQICRVPPTVICETEGFVWDQTALTCVNIPTTQETCESAGGNWNELFETCQIEVIETTITIEEICAEQGGVVQDGFCFPKSQGSPFAGLATLSASLSPVIIAGSVILLLIIIILFIRGGR